MNALKPSEYIITFSMIISAKSVNCTTWTNDCPTGDLINTMRDRVRLLHGCPPINTHVADCQQPLLMMQSGV